MRCLLIGNYGAGNIGDEALKEYFLTRFPQIDWIVVTARPRGDCRVPRLPMGLRSLFTPWWRTLIAYVRSDAVIFGGGSLCTDTESVGACLLWWWHGRVARLFRKPVLLAFQGIGPFRTRTGEWLARSLCRSAHFISVRDEESQKRIERWHLRVPVIRSFDPVLVMMPEKSGGKSQNLVSVIPRMNSGKALMDAITQCVQQHSSGSLQILSMQPDDQEERKLCATLGRTFGATIHDIRSLAELIKHVGASHHVITERYHGALAAASLGIPLTIIAQKPGDKLDGVKALLEKNSRQALISLVEEGERELQKSLNMI